MKRIIIGEADNKKIGLGCRMTPTQTIHEFAVKNLLVERYLLGELSGMDLDDFEQHLFECSICFDQVKAGRAFVRGMQAPPKGMESQLARAKAWIESHAAPRQASPAAIILSAVSIFIGLIIFFFLLLGWGKAWVE